MGILKRLAQINDAVCKPFIDEPAKPKAAETPEPNAVQPPTTRVPVRERRVVEYQYYRPPRREYSRVPRITPRFRKLS